MYRNIAVLGSGLHRNALFRYLDKHMWKRNGIWSIEDKDKFITDGVTKNTDLSAKFLAYPENRISPMANEPYIVVYPETMIGKDTYHDPRKIFYIPDNRHDDDDYWREFLFRIGMPHYKRCESFVI